MTERLQSRVVLLHILDFFPSDFRSVRWKIIMKIGLWGPWLFWWTTNRQVDWSAQIFDPTLRRSNVTKCANTCYIKSDYSGVPNSESAHTVNLIRVIISTFEALSHSAECTTCRLYSPRWWPRIRKIWKELDPGDGTLDVLHLNCEGWVRNFSRDRWECTNAIVNCPLPTKTCSHASILCYH